MPTNGMTIDGLNTVSSLTAQDEVPVWDKEASGEPTKKITAQNMTASVKTLGSLVNTSEMNDAIQQSTADVIRTGDVVNNLTSTSTTAPLSANMGKALNDNMAVVELSFTTTPSGVVSSVGGAMFQIGKIVIVDLDISMTGNITYDWINIATLPRFPRNFLITNTLPDQISAGASLRTRIRPDNGNVQAFYGGNGTYHVHAIYPTT